MTTAAFVNCQLSDQLSGGDRYRITFEQGAIQNWLAGGTLLSVYQALGNPTSMPWAFPVSEPPQEADQVMVIDLQIRNSTVGSSPPGTMTDLVQALDNQSTFNAYAVTRIERLTAGTLPAAQRSVVQSTALTDARHSGILGAVDTVLADVASGAKAAGAMVGNVASNLKMILIAGAVLAAAVVVIVYLPKPSHGA
jgi:hypothetical protein